MGFMDKAKQMAEQAQQKIEETQKQFNQSQAEKAAGKQAAGGAPVRYDSNGRPIQDDATPPASDPATAEAVSVPQPPEGVNATPDPFKPID